MRISVKTGDGAITMPKLFQIPTALDIPMPQLFCSGPGRPPDEREDRLERLIELLRGLDAMDLEVFNEILPRLVEWKGGNRASSSTSVPCQIPCRFSPIIFAARYYLIPTAAYRA